MHQPVLLNEVIFYLDPQPGKKFIDSTVGLGGHTLSLAKRVKTQGKVLGLEWDRHALQKAQERVEQAGLEKNIILIQGNFVQLKEKAERHGFLKVDGILFDLGISSWQIEKSGRGFSFQRDELLDMRFDSRDKTLITAAQIVNQWPEKKIAAILKTYGQERYTQRIARAIVEERKKKPIKKTFQLVEIIREATPKLYHRQRIHFATRTFQALRIAVNDEINNLIKALPQALGLLEKRGRLAVISFHSLEDRIVKNFFKQAKDRGQLAILTKKPLTPSQEEIKFNPRSRSAKLRVAEKIS